jgi:signal transduction histidine kinase/CheY-like chemotaxis protein
VEKRFLNKDEGILWAAMTVSLVRSAQGDPLFAIYMMEDISDRQQLQLQLQQSKKMETIGLLAGGIAHDFNNMLLSIMGYTELAKEKFAADGSGKLAAYLDQVLKASERARDLIAQLLAFSRNSELEFKPLQLKPLIKESLKMLRSALPSSIALKIDIEPNLPEVIADPTKLFQMMMNLCINARDAMNGSGHIRLALHTVQVDQQICQSCHQSYSGHYIELAVQDNGHGIARDILDKIFDPFFTTKEVGKGTGMGLSTVHGLVHEHGGHIQIESDAKAGTVVKLILPVSVAVPVDNDAMLTTSSLGEASNHATILVVDGEESIAQLIADGLRQKDCIVDIATDSHAALMRFERYPDQYDMVITEHIIPGFSGRRLAQKILQQKPYLPIIFCSGMNEHIKKNEIFQLGIQGFLQKPFNMQDLLDLVDELLSRKPARSRLQQIAKRA